MLAVLMRLCFCGEWCCDEPCDCKRADQEFGPYHENCLSFGSVMPGETSKRGEEFQRAVGVVNDHGASEFQPKTAFSLRSGKLIENARSSLGSPAMSNLLFLRRSYAYRHAAVEMMRKARSLPPGSERRATRQVARALKDLARNEAWLEGQVTKRQSVPRRAVRA